MKEICVCVSICVCVREGSTYILSTINAGDSPSDDVCKRKFKVVVNRKDMIMGKENVSTKNQPKREETLLKYASSLYFYV